MAVSTDYTGRTVDLLIVQGGEPAGRKPVTLDFAGGGRVTAGLQKLGQRFLVLFLQERNTIPSRLDSGTDFMDGLRSGRIRTDQDVRSEYAFAVERVKAAFRTDAAGRPADETFREARLLSFSLDKTSGKLSMSVLVVSAAGPGATILLPVTVPIR